MTAHRDRSRALLVLALSVVAATSAAAQTFTVRRTAIGGEGGSDYLAADTATGRVYVSRGTHVMVVDGASSHVCKDLVIPKNIRLLRLPPYASELNPQEHVWKATRRAVSHNHTQRRLPGLAKRFKDHLTASTFRSSFLDRYGWNLVCPRPI